MLHAIWDAIGTMIALLTALQAQSGCGTSPSSNSPPSKFGNGRHRRSMSSETAESSDGDFKSAV